MYAIETHGELYPFLTQEWLLTNGAGAFSASSVVGCNTRRYHGLLIAATKPPVGRIMALSRVGEIVHLDGKSEFQELSINTFRNSMHPRGDRYLRRFELGRLARWQFDVDGVKITKEVLLAWKKNTVGIRYQVEAPDERPVELKLLAFVGLRDFHALQSGNRDYEIQAEDWELRVGCDRQHLYLRADSGKFEKRSDWWYEHVYPIETDRGQDDKEDLFVPGLLSRKGTGNWSVTLWASTDGSQLLDWDEELASHPDALAEKKVRVVASGRREDAAQDVAASPIVQKLARAAADFIVERSRPDGKPGTTIIAGYPWFADWGRDTMIALPGLLLATRRYEEACQVLSVFSEYVSQGMIPNRFEDYTNEPTYNTVDASLWFVHACFEYLRVSGDRAYFEKQFLPACKQIIDGYRNGTRYHIQMDPADGLISAGDPNTQLTWMDAKCNGIAFTPRHGKAVEINALWYNALVLMKEEELASKVRQSFVKAFWISPFRGLNDCVTDGRKDPALRPNQIFAASLPNSPLDEDQQRAVVEVVRRELLTSYGLRTLAKSDPHYCGRYCGPQMERDRAYHNGTVWPWLIGPFLEGYCRVNHWSPDAVRHARVWLQPLIDHMNSGCIGQISECFEADEPHKPVAAPAQAWSVAEVLRMAVALGM